MKQIEITDGVWAFLFVFISLKIIQDGKIFLWTIVVMITIFVKRKEIFEIIKTEIELNRLKQKIKNLNKK